MRILNGNTTTSVEPKAGKTAVVKESNVSGNRRPNSTLALCALANYMVVNKICEANIGKYEAAVKSMEEGIVGNIIDNDGVVTFVAGETLPESLADKTILATYTYDMPVKHNLHINTMAKNYYNISMDEARAYKVTNDLFFVVDAVAKQKLLELCKLTDNKTHLPVNPNDIENSIQDIYIDTNAKVEIVSVRGTGAASPTSTGTKTATTKSTATRVNKTDGVLERVISKEKEASSVKRIPSSAKLTLNSTEYATLDVSEMPKSMALINAVQLRVCDTDPGNGHFSFVFEYPVKGYECRFIITGSDPLTGIMTVLTQRELSDDEMSLFIPIIINSESSGYKIHDIDKAKEKSPFIWNMANYVVFVQAAQ